MFREYPFPLGDISIMDGIDEGINMHGYILTKLYSSWYLNKVLVFPNY